MELDPLSYGKGPGQAIRRDAPLASYTWDHLPSLVVGDEIPAHNSVIVMLSRRSTPENGTEPLVSKIPHHDGQLAGVHLNLCWRWCHLRSRSGLGGVTGNRSYGCSCRCSV